MNWMTVIILAVLQGVSEFLPISSSGHLFLVQNVLGLNSDMLFFDVMLHFASGLAILVLLYRQVWEIFTNKKIFINIFISSLPVVIVGLLIKDWIGSIDKYLIVIGIGLLLTALFNFLVDKFTSEVKYKDLTCFSALKVGLLQVVALVPGVSRSGTTIIGGRMAGLSKESALKYSFLLALPAVFGASALELMGVIKDGSGMGVGLGQLILGMIVCFVVSFYTIKWFLHLVKKISFKYFAIYTFILGLLVIFLTR